MRHVPMEITATDVTYSPNSPTLVSGEKSLHLARFSRALHSDAVRLSNKGKSCRTRQGVGMDDVGMDDVGMEAGMEVGS